MNAFSVIGILEWYLGGYSKGTEIDRGAFEGERHGCIGHVMQFLV